MAWVIGSILISPLRMAHADELVGPPVDITKAPALPAWPMDLAPSVRVNGMDCFPKPSADFLHTFGATCERYPTEQCQPAMDSIVVVTKTHAQGELDVALARAKKEADARIAEEQSKQWSTSEKLVFGSGCAAAGAAITTALIIIFGSHHP